MANTSFDDLLKVFLAGGSLTAGAFLTALRAKLANTKRKNWLHLSFYIIASLVLFGALIFLISYWERIREPHWFAIIVLASAVVFSIALIWVTKKFLAGKYQYTISELNPVVNSFSINADKHNIKLLAGNLDFLGKSVAEIDQHPQFLCLKAEGFQQIQILCTRPVSNEDKLRYGKIITDLPSIQLRYYKPIEADLKVRGRIKTLNNVTRLLIYSKVSPGRYEALGLNTAETDGALYTHLWNLIWELAESPSNEQLEEYKRFYRP